MNLKTILRGAGILVTLGAVILSLASLDDPKLNPVSALALAVTALALFKGSELS